MLSGFECEEDNSEEMTDLIDYCKNKSSFASFFESNICLFCTPSQSSAIKCKDSSYKNPSITQVGRGRALTDLV